MTTSVFESYIALAEQPTPGSDAAPSLEERARALEDRVDVHTAVFEVMESRFGEEGLTEVHRPLIPVYQRWMNAARQLVVLAREMRAAGRPILSIDKLVFAINRAKFVADDFDYTVQSNERARRGDFSGYIPWAEVERELRAQRESESQG